MVWLEVDGEVEHASFIRGALWALQVAMPLGEIVHQGSHRHIGQGTQVGMVEKVREEERSNGCGSLIFSLFFLRDRFYID